jgi:hypothetical protein
MAAASSRQRAPHDKAPRSRAASGSARQASELRTLDLGSGQAREGDAGRAVSGRHAEAGATRDRCHPISPAIKGDAHQPIRPSDGVQDERIRTDEFTGVHRTFLTDTAQKISKTILGRKHGSAIKIDRAEGAGLAIAEGVETTIAARYLYRPAWSVIDAGGVRHFPVLPAIEHLEIFADHDVNGAGEAAARECLARWENAGAEVAIVMPPTAGSDIADFIAKRKVY